MGTGGFVPDWSEGEIQSVVGWASAPSWRVADSLCSGRKILGDNGLRVSGQSATRGGLALGLADWLTDRGIQEQGRAWAEPLTIW